MFQIYVKNFSLAIQHELAPYGITVQSITPLYVRTKMNNYSTTVSNGNILCPDVETYTRSAVASLGRTNETTGFWIHGIQVSLFDLWPSGTRSRNTLHNHIDSNRIDKKKKQFSIDGYNQHWSTLIGTFIFIFAQYATCKLIPQWARTIIGAKLNEKFRNEYFAQQQSQDCK